MLTWVLRGNTLFSKYWAIIAELAILHNRFFLYNSISLTPCTKAKLTLFARY